MRSPLIISTVNPIDSSLTILSIRANRYGNMLIAGPTAHTHLVEVTNEQIRSMFDQLFRFHTDASANNLYPFPEHFDLVTRQGTFSIGPDIAESLSTVLFMTIIDQDLSEDMMKEFQPE